LSCSLFLIYDIIQIVIKPTSTAEAIITPRLDVEKKMFVKRISRDNCETTDVIIGFLLNNDGRLKIIPKRHTRVKKLLSIDNEAPFGYPIPSTLRKLNSVPIN